MAAGTDLFIPQQYGTIIRVKMPGGSLPAVVSVQDSNGAAVSLFQQSGVILTGFSHDAAANYQIQRSLGNVHYIYSFGDKPGEAVVTGICVPLATCGGTGSSEAGTGGANGVDDLMAYYEQNKVNATLAAAGGINIATVTMVVGQKTALRGVLVGCRLSCSDTRYRIVNFSLGIRTLSKESAT